MAKVVCPEPGSQVTLMSYTAESTSPATLKVQVELLYGPPVLLDVAPFVWIHRPQPQP